MWQGLEFGREFKNTSQIIFAINHRKRLMTVSIYTTLLLELIAIAKWCYETGIITDWRMSMPK